MIWLGMPVATILSIPSNYDMAGDAYCYCTPSIPCNYMVVMQNITQICIGLLMLNLLYCHATVIYIMRTFYFLKETLSLTASTFPHDKTSFRQQDSHRATSSESSIAYHNDKSKRPVTKITTFTKISSPLSTSSRPSARHLVDELSRMPVILCLENYMLELKKKKEKCKMVRPLITPPVSYYTAISYY